MKRTGEKVFIIIATICNLISIFITSVVVVFLKNLINDPKIVEDYLNDPTVMNEVDGEALTIDEFQESMNAIAPYINGFAVVFIGAMVISLILGLVAFRMLSKKDKINTAGILVLISGVLAGILSLTSILYYIAGIMCFIRKPKTVEAVQSPSKEQ